MGLSNLGIFHTVIGIIAIISAIISLIKSGKINLDTLAGKIYFYFTLISSLTALGLSSVKGVNPGHILALLIVMLISVAYILYVRKKGNNGYRLIENFFLSFSFFLSLIPTVNETFSRVPVGNPIASGPKDPIIGTTILFIFVLFIIGSILQFRKQKRINKNYITP
ncbi:hypothetical protein [Chryseobacterium geocarposphaerae]|uniref:Transmembrane protein n=1 Tax=Chryseobacterium geocarposphaerae TaxID=1416776 RepID=A0A2M9C6H2_9FLAO|nr:hypothetical protein [Chryseobacterium geocarposphaerae]PJJ66420.1 hypothetical protein CLV73_0403 [Chryseobacterium geocarposphaerae]PJJ66448.1 hypothetical protein CLV73_0432 [Chryseobacterium geocarposphaerae]